MKNDILACNGMQTAFHAGMELSIKASLANRLRLERETGIEPATNSLEGCRSVENYGHIGLTGTFNTHAERAYFPKWHADGMRPSFTEAAL